MEALKSHSWPGNVRELQNVIERGVIISTDGVLSRETTAKLRSEARPAAQLPSVKTLADAERAHIMATLRETKGVVGGPCGAAVQLGLPRTTLIARMRRLGICMDTSGRMSRPFVTRNQTADPVCSTQNDDSWTNLRAMEASVAF